MKIVHTLLLLSFAAGAFAQGDQTKPFFDAIRSGNETLVQKMLDENPSLIKSMSKRGHSILAFAALANQKQMVPLLERRGAPLDFTSALVLDRYKDVERMLQKDPSLATSLTPDGSPPLCYAAGGAHPDVTKLLLDYHARLDQEIVDFMHVAPINSAVFGRNLDCVKLIGEAGADLNHVEDDNWTPLDEAAENGDLAIVKYLVEHGARTDIATTKEGKTAIFYAAKHPDVVAYLKEH